MSAPVSIAASLPDSSPRRAPRRTSIVRRLVRRRSLAVSLLMFLGIYAACYLIPLFRPGVAVPVAAPFAPPSLEFPFGTDSLGRDVFGRTFAAGQIDITIALLAVGFSAIVGTIVGTASALAGGHGDAVFMRFVDALIAFPYLIIVLLLVIVIGPNVQFGPVPRGLAAVLIALILVGWTFYARLGRGQGLSVRNMEYVMAAEVLGYSRIRTLFRHVLPGVVPVSLAYAASDLIITMGALASFAFLGLGVQGSTPEWGAMMFEGRAYLAYAWWVALFPGLLLTVTGLTMSVVADRVWGDP